MYRKSLALFCATLASTTVYADTSNWTLTRLGLFDATHTESTSGTQVSYSKFINDAGQVAGISYSYTDNYGGNGSSGWFYDGVTTRRLGLTGSQHVDQNGLSHTDVWQMNANGQILGSTRVRRNDPVNSGSPRTWLYDSQTDNYTILGLQDSDHTRVDGTDWVQSTILNSAGQVAGVSKRFIGASDTDLGKSAWFYDGVSTARIGFYDGAHTSSMGTQISNIRRLNDAGYTMGVSSRYNGNAGAGQSVWIYDGTASQRIGLTGVGFTRTDNDWQYSDARSMNDAGQVAGYSSRYAGSTYQGTSAWIYQNGATTEIGLYSGVHTSASGSTGNRVTALNNNGEVIGYATRWQSGSSNGQSAWFYNGAVSTRIGLVDAEHTSSTGRQFSEAQHLTDSGWIGGQSERFNGGGSSLGQSAWLSDGTDTTKVGHTDARHTSDTGVQNSSVEGINDSGQAVGYSTQYDGAGYGGQTAWFYDPSSDQYTDLVLSLDGNGFSYTTVKYLGDDGTVLGTYRDYDNGGKFLAFYFNPDEGLFDFEDYLLQHNVDIATEGWFEFDSASAINSLGQIIGGGGNLNDGIGGDSTYLLTPAVSSVPVPAAAWLFASALAGLFGLRRKR